MKSAPIFLFAAGVAFLLYAFMKPLTAYDVLPPIGCGLLLIGAAVCVVLVNRLGG